ncbi:MAG: hypothetical protein AAGA34_05640 [Pseudomonadota bacterium]
MPSAPIASLINVAVLIIMSAWGYLGSANPSLTALIPAAFGVALLACHPGVKAENKVVAHIAVVLTLLVFLALFMPMRGAISRGDAMAGLRVGAMLGASLVALIAFIRSFIAARKAREAAAE